VLVDVGGYFVADAPSFEGLAPVRLADTREGATTIDGASQGGGALAGDDELAVRMISRGGVLPAAAAVALNVTAVDMEDAGYLTVFPCGQEPPNASNVNYATGQTIANSVTVKIGAGGAVCVYSSAAGHVIVDVAGYFPAPGGPAAGSGTVQVAAGFDHTCALRSAMVWCWGANGQGQVGDGSWIDRPTPSEVTGLPPTVALAAGSRHTCALGADGLVRCWGANDVGQLGDATTQDRPAPALVAGPSGVTAIGAGTDHSCAVDVAHRVWCWGMNDDDEILTGDGADVTSPRLIAEVGGDIVAVDGGGSHTCAIRSGGDVVCWGANYYGQLGGGALEPETGIEAVVGLPTRAVAISAGWVHSCAVLTDGSLWCWGNGDAGQLGTGESSFPGQPSVDRPTPVRVPDLAGVVDVAAAVGHTCATLGDGSARCWGINAAGQLGDGTQDNRVRPVTVVDGNAATHLSAAPDGEHACIVQFDEELRCWGRNAEGQLGNTDVGTFAWTAVAVEGW
jgi:alpha-tubulin suppressor-like RCC1 family protein